MKRKLGGKGISVLFGDEDVEKSKYTQCAISKIVPNKYQPRSYFDEKELQELSDSIRAQGIIQPLIVVAEENDEFMLVAGERRLRAARLAGLSEVPIVISEQKGEDDLLEIALIENIQRTDLNPIEEAEAYKKLIDKFNYTQAQVSQKIGKQRSTVTNLLRLLKLPKDIQKDIVQGVMSEGHARVLVKFISSPEKLEKLRNEIVKNMLSVRQTEKAARLLEEKESTPLPPKSDIIAKSYLTSLSQKLTSRFHSKISIAQQKGGKGKIQINYQSPDDLERITSLLLSHKEQ